MTIAGSFSGGVNKRKVLMKKCPCYRLCAIAFLMSLLFSTLAFATTATNISVTTDQDVPVQITLQGSGLGKLIYSVVSAPANGSVSLSTNVATYTPTSFYSGTDSFVYQIKDRTGRKARAKVTITVIAAPIISAEPVDVLIGFWGLNGYLSPDGLADIKNRFKSTVFQISSSGANYTVNTLLPMVRDAGLKVTLRMTPGHSSYSTNGNFDLALWKSYLSTWQNSGIQEFIDDGTLVGHMLLDDIDDFTGTDPTAADLDEMARFSQEILPGLMAFVRCQATKMPVPENGQYIYVDAVVNQYKASEGPVETYVANQLSKAQSLGVDIINGMNICDGGDGSSGQQGWRSDKFAMTAEEIVNYGEVLMSVPDLKLFLMWEYDGEEVWPDGTIGSDYFDQPDLQAALSYLGDYATP